MSVSYVAQVSLFGYISFIDCKYFGQFLVISIQIVCVLYFIGENESFFGSGTIVEVDVIDGIYWGLILTSASLIRQSPNDHVVAQDIKVSPCLCM